MYYNKILRINLCLLIIYSIAVLQHGLTSKILFIIHRSDLIFVETLEKSNLPHTPILTDVLLQVILFLIIIFFPRNLKYKFKQKKNYSDDDEDDVPVDKLKINLISLPIQHCTKILCTFLTQQPSDKCMNICISIRASRERNI